MPSIAIAGGEGDCGTGLSPAERGGANRGTAALIADLSRTCASSYLSLSRTVLEHLTRYFDTGEELLFGGGACEIGSFGDTTAGVLAK